LGRRSVQQASRSGSSPVMGLCKKLYMYIHPDFFTAFPALHEVNEANMKHLSNMVEAHDQQQQRPYAAQQQDVDTRGARTLTFYLKATDESPQPRRIRVGIGSLARIEDSIRDILETLGVALNPPSESESLKMRRTHAFKSTVTSSAEIEEYLASLVDRAEILTWRAERRGRFLQCVEELQHTLGVEEIDIRYSWGAESNITMLTTLLRLVDEERVLCTQHTPWTGLKLVMSSDDASLPPVDPIEGHVVINPSHVPLQWLQVMNAVSLQLLTAARACKVRIASLQRRAEDEFSRKLKDALRAELSAIGEEALEAVSVRVMRGHTCDGRWFLSWLENLDLRVRLDEEAVVLPENGAGQGGQEGAKMPQQSSSSNANSDVSSMHERVSRREAPAMDVPSKIARSTALTTGGWLSLLPLQLIITCEQGHGTKLLGSGTFRVDCRATSGTISSLLTAEAREALTRVVHEAALQRRTDELISALKEHTAMAAIEAGVGVNALMFYGCLERMCEHCDARGRGQLSNLSGKSIRIGRYIGMSDDGFVILPHDMQFYE